jgi:hypothetical protein
MVGNLCARQRRHRGIPGLTRTPISQANANSANPEWASRCFVFTSNKRAIPSSGA